MRRRYKHLGTGGPGDARWYGGADPQRKWAVTLKAPIAHLLSRGDIWGVTSSLAPPVELIGQRLGLHAGTSPEALKRIDETARRAVAKATGQTLETWRKGLERWHGEAGQLVGSAVLSAAFRTSGLTEHNCVRPLRPDGEAHAYLGDWWDHFWGLTIKPVGDWEAGRWVWCFRDPRTVQPAQRPAPLKGNGYVWDVAKALALQTSKKGDLAA